jgi:hypothetical protein
MLVCFVVASEMKVDGFSQPIKLTTTILIVSERLLFNAK